MSSRNIIQDELNDFNSELPSNPGETPYSVPAGYFEGLASSVMAKIKNQETLSASDEIVQLSPLLAGIPRKMPLTTPENYFRDNMEILPFLTSENEESIVLSFIDKTMPYDVPFGYFENLPYEIVNRVKPKVIPMMRRKWMRMAAAAVMVGIMAIAGFNYFGSKAASSHQSVAQMLKTVSDKDLEEFINTTAVPLNNNVTAQRIPGSDVKKMLQDVSDKDLNNFLDQIPTDDAMTN